MKQSKIFIIGLHKTGTTSLAYFFEKMGYLVTGPDTHLVAQIENDNFKEVDRLLTTYDVFQDDPWYMIYPYLYQKYPEARFILLERNKLEWIKSVQRFYGEDNYNNAVRRKFYGSANTIQNEEAYLSKFTKHNEEVKDFFSNEDNFISISIANDADVIKLQKFLNKPIKFKSFPHKNKTPKTKSEKKNKQIIMLLKGGFGLKTFIKKELKAILGYHNFIKLRTQIRFFNSKTRRFFLKLFSR